MTRRSDSAAAIRYALAVAAVAFGLHLAWEYGQCTAFFIHDSAPPTAAEMLRATHCDVALTALAYAGVAAVTRHWRWPLLRWTPLTWVALEGLAVVLSLAVEAAALRSGRWRYTPAAPIIPGTGISMVPTLQLLILLPASFLLARSLRRR